MRSILIALIFVSACTQSGDADKQPPASVKDNSPQSLPSPPQPNVVVPKAYANDRFKNVTVKKTGLDTYQVTGEAQIFEASFNWVIEDGHNELKSGYSTTDAGAPAWGNFDFTVSVAKERENSLLHLILFEASAEDGRRTHELPIVLQ